jgi:hypothetical protein
MPLSSDSLFHYTTGGMPAIKGILSNGFRISYCEEQLPFHYRASKDIPGYVCQISQYFQAGAPDKYYIYIPMVCFCDIPIANINTHLKRYGVEKNGKMKAYSIGLSKSWGTTKGLNQVMYLIANSSVSREISWRFKTSNYYSNVQITDSEGNKKYKSEIFPAPKPINIENGMVSDNIGSIIPFETLFTKPIGEVSRKTTASPIVATSFVDEKEWRYVPENACIINGYMVFAEECHDHLFHIRARHESKALHEARSLYSETDTYLKFGIDDINHIVVGLDNEIPEIQRHLKEEFKDKRGVTDDQLYLLFSKVTSYETLERDFFSH